MTNFETFKKETADRLQRVQRALLPLRGYRGGNVADTAWEVEVALNELIAKIEAMRGDETAIILCPECKRELCPHELESGRQYFCHKCKTYYKLPTNPYDWERRNPDLKEETK